MQQHICASQSIVHNTRFASNILRRSTSQDGVFISHTLGCMPYPHTVPYDCDSDSMQLLYHGRFVPYSAVKPFLFLQVEGNPCLAYIRLIILPWFNSFEVQRSEAQGGNK